MNFAIPPKPDEFTPQGVAPGCERVANLYERGLMGRRVDVLSVHTNWASGEGSIESAVRWTLANPGTNTYAHYQHDRDGRAAKMLDTDRRGIGTGGVTSWWRDTYGLPNASYRSLTYETADRGTRLDPNPMGSPFTDAQMAALARDLAYECVVHDIPPVLLASPDGRGIAGHCHPFPYPAFTTAKGKECPGHLKYAQLVETVIPWTAAIVKAWTAPPPPEEPDMPLSDEDVKRVAAGIDLEAIAKAVWRYQLKDGAPGPNHGKLTNLASFVAWARRDIAQVHAELRALAERVAELAAKVGGSSTPGT